MELTLYSAAEGPRTGSVPADMPAVAVMWVNFGPYHLARLAALRRQFRVSAIELASHQSRYGWTAVREGLADPIHTLATGPYEQQSWFRLILAMWKTLSRLRPKMLLVAGYSEPAALAAAVWCMAHRKTAVLMTESTLADYPRRGWRERLKALWVRLFFRYAVVGGERSAAYVEMLGMPRNKIFRGYDVVDNAHFSRSTRALRAAANPRKYRLPARYFLFVGRLAPEKNLHRLIQAFARYRTLGGDWELVLVGDGPLREQLPGAARAAAIAEKVHFAGFRNGDEMLPFYAFAGCFILPSIKEPWGLVVNEAMASGLPVLVSTSCGCSSDLVFNGENGFVFDPRDEAKLAELMFEMSSCQETVRVGRAARSLEIIRNHSPETFASEVKRIAKLEGIVA